MIRIREHIEKKMAVGFRTERNTKKTSRISGMVKLGWKALKMRDGSWDLIMKYRMCVRKNMKLCYEITWC